MSDWDEIVSRGEDEHMARIEVIVESFKVQLAKKVKNPTFKEKHVKHIVCNLKTDGFDSNDVRDAVTLINQQTDNLVFKFESDQREGSTWVRVEKKYT